MLKLVFILVIAIVLLPKVSLVHADINPVFPLVNCGVDENNLVPTITEQSVIDQNNLYRIQHGLSVLIYSPNLSRMALYKATLMAQQGNADHDDGFRTWQQRFTDCGFPVPGTHWMGENLAGGQHDAREVEFAWQDSPHHNENLLNEHFTYIAVKLVMGIPPYFYYWVMELSGA